MEDFLKFTSEDAKYVCFFYRLPDHIRNEYQAWYEEMSPTDDLDFVKQYAKEADYLMTGLNERKHKYITNRTDDFTYFMFMKYYAILQPTIETIINGNNLYEEYPEYLI